ncbi:cation diffusion facilitator family transporter [Aestuariispira insulae]|uniref:Cation diffusion facilitator family transporter n=1 Tax=Aestuariispira insulae TaxID=1461337 RepID=A0A3D9HX66_9PROT|nr:cation diffusion facilitator family transporter [Aestuariispira insulae]RED54087.1 cation diffusion facilitator family transporter [Aestuariispira insulae]
MASGSKKVILAGITANFLIAVAKFVASAFTGSAAMFSEGIHSLVDTGNQALLLYGMGRAARPADKRHPFGYSMELYFWSFVVAILIFAVGAGVSFYEGVEKVLHPVAVHDPTVNYIVLAVAFVIEGFAWWVAFKEFNRARGDRGMFEAIRKTKDPAVMAVLLEDSAAMIGLMVAFTGIFLGQVLNMPVLDGMASIGIGVVLTVAAIILAIETKGLLIGESADMSMVESVRTLVLSHPQVTDVNEALSMHLGPEDILMTMSLDFSSDATADDVEEAVSRMETAIKEKHPQIRRVFIEAQSIAAHHQAVEVGQGA